MKPPDIRPYTIEEFGPIGPSGRLTHIAGYDVYLDGRKVCQIPIELLKQPREEIILEIERLSAE